MWHDLHGALSAGLETPGAVLAQHASPLDDVTAQGDDHRDVRPFLSHAAAVRAQEWRQGTSN